MLPPPVVTPTGAPETVVPALVVLPAEVEVEDDPPLPVEEVSLNVVTSLPHAAATEIVDSVMMKGARSLELAAEVMVAACANGAPKG